MTKKITQLTELTSAVGADLLEIVDDVAGTPTSKKITLTNLLSSAANQTPTGAIDFSSASSFTLPSGTWTPTIFGSTIAGVNGYSTQNGNYTLVGDLCYVDFDVQLNGTFTSIGNLRIGGLPFNCANSNGSVNISFSGGNLGDATPISAATTASSNHLRLQHYATNTATNGLANTEVSNTFRASGHIVYKIA